MLNKVLIGIQKNFLSIVSLMLMVIVMIFIYKLDNTQTSPTLVEKIIEKQIETAGKEVREIETRVVIDKQETSRLSNEILRIKQLLDQYKTSEDTLGVIATQDTLIGSLTLKTIVLESTIGRQDSIIDIQKEIISAQGSLLEAKDLTIKKVKRQRNISLAANGVLLVGVILK